MVASAAILTIALVVILAARFLHRTARLDVVGAIRSAEPWQVDVQSVDHDETGNERRQLVFRDANGVVRADVRIPAGDGPVAAVVVLGGLRTGRHAVDLVDPELPYAVAALDYANDAAASLTGVEAIIQLPRLVRDLVRTGVVFRDLARHVAADPRVDPARVFVFGASLGTPLACAVTAAQPFAGLVLLYGFADHETLVAHRLRPTVGWAPARTALARFCGWITYGFDARQTLPRACGTPVLVIGSPEDDAIPRTCRDALWDAACPPRERIDLPGGHIDAGRKETVLQQATQAVRVWLEPWRE